MNKYFRGIIALALVLGVVLLAKDNIAWAGQKTEVDSSGLAQDEPSILLAEPEPGSVKPPPPTMFTCEPGVYPVGGPVVIHASKLTDGYCLSANLRPPFAKGRLPKGAGDFLSDTVLLRYYKNESLQYTLPTESGEVKVCFAVPPGKEAQIYFYDFYGPRSNGGQGQPSWVLVETTVENGIACAPAMTSGVYALVGQ